MRNSAGHTFGKKAVTGRALSIGCLMATANLAGCFSMQNQTTIDGVQEATSKLPIVEAVIEYPGPQDRWAGPVTFTMQIVAKDAGPAIIKVSPALFQGSAVRMKENEVDNRAPASGKGLSGEEARDRLAHLAASLSGGEESFRGCLYPIRLRFVRADGSLSEKKGCRGQSSWSRNVSQSVNDFILSSLGQG